MTVTSARTGVLPPATERVVRELVKEGESNAVLARALGVAEQTVKAHLAYAMRVSKTRTRTALALWWIRRGQYQETTDVPVSTFPLSDDDADEAAPSVGFELRQRIPAERDLPRPSESGSRRPARQRLGSLGVSPVSTYADNKPVPWLSQDVPARFVVAERLIRRLP